MKFTPEVIAALQTLKNAAENDFERHRISVLEKDLTAPPVVEIIDENYQFFCGEVFHKDKGGHFRRDTSLHRFVFYYYNGDIPNGYEIHHKDLDPSNNATENLQLLSKSEHQKLHHKLNRETQTCPVCGKLFVASNRNGRTRFCSQKCKDSIKNLNLESVEKICPICGKSFSPKDKRRACCSQECTDKLKSKNHTNKHQPRNCAVCGKVFIPKDKRNVCCSRDCGSKYAAKNKKESRQKVVIKRTCPTCGKIFEVPFKSSKRRFCSTSCGTIHQWNEKKSEQNLSQQS